MRIIVFFDLPSTTYIEQKNYRKFHKFLINDGYGMMQESIYTKLALNSSIAKGLLLRLKQNKPPHGTVQVLTITEKQFAQMEYIVGHKTSKLIDDEERLIIL